MNEGHRPAASRGEQFRANLILLAVAVIWGSAFVAQRTGMERIGPFTFNGVRFALGSLVLFPFLGWRRMPGLAGAAPPPSPTCVGGEWRSGVLLGLLLFAGASFQQAGLVYTTAGKAGFITGLYVVLVPLLSVLVWRVRVGWSAWLGAGLAMVGLSLLSAQSLQGGFRLAPGDGWVLAGAFAWALHVIGVGRIVPGRDPLRLAMAQYGVCALLCLIVAVALEQMVLGDVLVAKWPVLYAGVLSTGLAYTGQIVAQRHAASTHAALILSMEALW
jgi:drug/metabolite transporter (DMT)-like permease